MTDNIRPDHYRKGEIDLYEAFSQMFPHNEYRAGMQMIAMRYMFRDKIDRVEDLKKAIYSLERLKEKEIEYKEKQVKSKGEVIDDAIAFADHFRKEKTRKTPEEALGDMFEAFANMGQDFSETFHKYDCPEPIDIMKPKVAGQYLDEIYFEHDDLLKRLWNADYLYLARDENGELYAFEGEPKKYDDMDFWDTGANDSSLINKDNFPEIQWTDEEPTKIFDLLVSYSKEDAITNLRIKTVGEYLNETYLAHGDLLKRLLNDKYSYLARDRNGLLYTYSGSPDKFEDDGYWDLNLNLDSDRIDDDNFPEVKWSDEEPTKIADLLDIYQNGGENGK